MIRIRAIETKDVDHVLQLSQIPGMFNLPPDREALLERIDRSMKSFNGSITELSDTKYTFVAEDTETGAILGTSMVAGQHGTQDSPHFYFQVGREERFSSAIGTGFIHGTLLLGYDVDGPTEIGALVVEPSARDRPERIGRQLSFARFQYIATQRDRFRDQIIAELLPPLNRRGLSPLWEAIGRRFTNMDYWEADRLCAQNKDFIFDLFPNGKIYTTFLTAEARNSIGKVGEHTQPVFHILTRIGFKYADQIDPFDGGPHLWAQTDEIEPVRQTSRYTYGAVDEDSPKIDGLVHRQDPSHPFTCYSASVRLSSDGILAFADDDAQGELEQAMKLRPGDSLFFTPYFSMET